MPEKILVIDDDSLITLLMSEIIELAGFESITSNDVEEGIRLAHDKSPDVVILDIMMPGKDGIEVCKDIRTFSTIPIIFSTARDDLGTIVECFDAGANDFLSKPFKIDDLIEHIKNFLKIKTSQPSKKELLIRNLTFNNFILCLKSSWEWQEKTIKRRGDNVNNIPQNLEQYRNFIGSVAHSIKGELGHIKYAASSLLESSQSQEDAKNDYEMISRSCDYSFLLMQKVMNFLEMGISLSETVDLSDVLAQVEPLSRQRLPSKGINLQFIVEKTTRPPLVTGDSVQIMGVIKELIDNAITELRGKGGEIDVYLTQNKNKTILRIKDNGQGVPKEIREKIFKEHISGTKGSGWGLYLSYKTVKDMGGDLKIKSVVGKGTEFIISFKTKKQEIIQ